MDPVTVGRYKPEQFAGPWTADGSDGGSVLGYVETANWIVWEFSDGSLHVFNGRRPEGGVRGREIIVHRSTADEMPDSAITVDADGFIHASAYGLPPVLVDPA